MKPEIRSFVIIAHIDHGKSTLADRFLELTETVSARKMHEQYLDMLELERERGITIKMAPVRMKYHPDRRTAQKETQKDAEFLYPELTYKIRGLIFDVRKQLGLGHKEQVYHSALEVALKNSGMAFESKKNVPVVYEGKKVGAYQPDFVVEDKILIELKALPEIGRPQVDQLWTYLKGSNYKLALLVNFGSRDLEIKRVVYDTARDWSLRDSASSQRNSAQVEEYILNLIDTPGHSDFSYEVSRALKAVEGAILLVDATQGIQAQTLANLEAAKSAGLTIIGALNKIDMHPEGVDELAGEVASAIGVPPEEIHRVSAKTSEGVRELLDAVVEKVPAPKDSSEKSALIFSSLYDDHKGVVAFVRVFGGMFRSDEKTRLFATGADFKIKEVGVFSPEFLPADLISAGEIGYIATGLKDPDAILIGDTIGESVLPGFQVPNPVVFVSFYPHDASDYDDLRTALHKLRLNDSSLTFSSDFSPVLGRGFKCGFLGRLHFEITMQRLMAEFDQEVVNSFPSVRYEVKTKRGETVVVETPKDFPDDPEKVLEPYVKLNILVPERFLGAVLELRNYFRFGGVYTKKLAQHLQLTMEMPLADLVLDFDDKLKSASQGFASFSYEPAGYREGRVKKLDILVAGDEVPGLSRIVPEKDLYAEARKMAGKLKELLPRKQFVQAIQATSGGTIVARETISALRKNVTGGLYGGDRTRKDKLLKKQKKGKKRLKERGSVEVTAEVFRELLKR